MDLTSLLLPFAYLATLLGSLATFSYLYRRRQASKAASLQPWFPTHTPRNIYLSLLELQSKPDTKVPDSVLRAALLRRAVEDIQRLIQIRNSKQALSQLLQRGAVGDELWQRFQIAEKEMELELKDVVEEANALAPQQQWGSSIFQSAGELAAHDGLRKKLDAIEATREEERAAWEIKRESVREEFMKELDEDSSAAATASSPAKKQASDDGVLVDANVPDSPQGK